MWSVNLNAQQSKKSLKISLIFFSKIGQQLPGTCMYLWNYSVYINLKDQEKESDWFCCHITVVTVENRLLFLNFLALIINSQRQEKMIPKMSGIYLYKNFK